MIDPASLLALFVLAPLAGVLVAILATRRSRITVWRRRTGDVALSVVGLLTVWVVANRILRIPTGAARPSQLLLVAAAIAALALALLHWETHVQPGARWLRHGYRAYAARSALWDTVAIAAVAALLRAGVMFRAPAFVIGDSGVLIETMTTVVERLSFDPIAGVYPPLYPLFMLAVRALMGPDFLAVVAVQHVLGIWTAVGTYWLARSSLPAPLALLPGLGMATNGYTLILEHGIYSEALFIPLAVAFGVGGVWWVREGTHRHAAAAGGALALAALTRLVIQFALPLTVLLLLLRHRSRRAVVSAATFALAFTLTASPWLAYNWVNYGFVGLSNSTGMQILVRLWEEEGGYEWANSDHRDPTLRRALEALQQEKDRGRSWWDAWVRMESEFPERDTSALVTAATLDVIRRQPATYLDRTWFRLNRMWRGGFTKERIHDLYGQQEALGIRSPIFEVRDEREFEALTEREGNHADSITLIFRPDRIPARVTLGLTIAAAAGGAFLTRLRPLLLPLGLGLGLMLFPVVINADRARYLHPAEPFLLTMYATGGWTIALALAATWKRVLAAVRSGRPPARA